MALPANIGAMVMARPLVESMASEAGKASLANPAVIMEEYDRRARTAEEGYKAQLDELERVKAEAYIALAKQAAVEVWEAQQAGRRWQGRAPRVDDSYVAA